MKTRRSTGYSIYLVGNEDQEALAAEKFGEFPQHVMSRVEAERIAKKVYPTCPAFAEKRGIH